MARVRYVRSPRDVEDAKNARRVADEGPIRLLRCRYETDPEAIGAVVPKPLEVAPECEVEIVVGARGSAGALRAGAMIAARVEYDGLSAAMPLSMPCDDEAAVLEGRERFGEPRKRAFIDFEGSGDDVSAGITRREVPFLRVGGARGPALDPAEWRGTSFSFKAFPSADPAKDFDHDPQLVRSDWRFVPASVWRIEGGLELWDSPHDPIADLPVRRLVELTYAEGYVRREARIVRPVPGDWLLPFLHLRDDTPETEGVEV